MAADATAIEFESRVDATLQACCELARALIGALAALGALALDALARVRKLRAGEEVPILAHDGLARFVQIESV